MAKTQSFDQYPNDYENWFTTNKYAYESELEAIKYFIPESGKGIEIGMGSGLFAKPLGIQEGVEPSEAMRDKAQNRGLNAFPGVAEKLPYQNHSIDFTLMVTTICFVDDLFQALSEANRILKSAGSIIIGFVDKESYLGQKYLRKKDKSRFYKDAHFISTTELLEKVAEAGFINPQCVQTLSGDISEMKNTENFVSGYGKGSFVVLKAEKA